MEMQAFLANMNQQIMTEQALRQGDTKVIGWVMVCMFLGTSQHACTDYIFCVLFCMVQA